MNLDHKVRKNIWTWAYNKMTWATHFLFLLAFAEFDRCHPVLPGTGQPLGPRPQKEIRWAPDDIPRILSVCRSPWSQSCLRRSFYSRHQVCWAPDLSSLFRPMQVTHCRGHSRPRHHTRCPRAGQTQDSGYLGSHKAEENFRVIRTSYSNILLFSVNIKKKLKNK